MSRAPEPVSMTLSRRTLLRRGLTAAGAVSLSSVLAACNVPYLSSSEAAPEFPVEGPEEALQRLMEGNQRYASGTSKPINESADRRTKVAERQRPFAAILSCVDSRVPPELVFDRGLGDLFVVRTAGEVVDSAVMGSLEYGAYELEIPLLVVLGHMKCGAMKAAMDIVASGGKADGSMEYLVEALRPAVGDVKPAMGIQLSAEVSPQVAPEVARVAGSPPAHDAGSGGHDASTDPAVVEAKPPTNELTMAAAEGGAAAPDGGAAQEPTAASETPTATVSETSADSSAEGGVDASADTAADGGEADGEDGGVKVDALTAAIKRNITLTVARVSASPIIAERIRKDRLRVVGAIYDLETGLVELTDNIPKQFLPTDGSADTQA